MMDRVKLIALDMDGTLFNSQNEISEKDKETLKRATEAGVAVAVATGRAYVELPIEMLYEAGIRYAITGNGSAVYRLPDKECILSDCLDNEVVCTIIRELKQLDIYYDIYVDGLVYCPKSVCHNIRKMDMPESLHEHIERTRIVVDDLEDYIRSCGKSVEKTTLNFAYLEDGTCLGKAESAAILDRYPQVEYLSGGFHNWEFTRAGVNKGTGLRFLAERIGVPMNLTMACGDSENDLSMLRAAQVAVAMENAKPAVKEESNYITLSNNESGVAHAIEHFVFGEE
jgi:Cof subfamily protein (haloacid dehalogenase superfamily)